MENKYSRLNLNSSRILPVDITCEYNNRALLLFDINSRLKIYFHFVYITSYIYIYILESINHD